MEKDKLQETVKKELVTNKTKATVSKKNTSKKTTSPTKASSTKKPATSKTATTKPTTTKASKATTPKTTTSKTAATKTATKVAKPKTATSKKTTKTPAKKTVVRKVATTTKKPTPKKAKPTAVVEDILLDELKQEPVVTKVAPKKTVAKTAVKKKPKEEVKRLQPKAKNYTKEEKKLYKKLEDAFTYVVNLTNVIESQKMNKSEMPDLTLGEVHVIETVAKNNNKPMTFIANKLKITVGASTISINRLVQKGYLIRTRDEIDRRVIILSVTPKGRRILKSHDKFHDDILGLVLDKITIRDATKVMTMFAEVLENYYNPQPSIKTTKTPSKGKEKGK